MLEQWLEHLVKVGVPVNQIGMYDGDRSRKHGLLRACERDKQARASTLCPRLQPCQPKLQLYVLAATLRA